MLSLIGCLAPVGVTPNLRKLEGRFKEYDIKNREEMRNAPVIRWMIYCAIFKKLLASKVRS